MPQTTLCRLCISTCSRFKCLYDDSGQLNGVYEIAVKYFDPRILTRRNGGDKTIVICMECWQHIQDFYSFQQTVLQNQTQLKTLKLAVRMEKLPGPMVQNRPPIKDKTSVAGKTISVFDIVQIQNTDTPKTTVDTNYDIVIKDQSIIFQIPSNIEAVTSLDKVCEQQLQESTDVIAAHDGVNCNICGNTYGNLDLLQQHYQLNHATNDGSMEIDQIQSDNFVVSFVQPNCVIGGVVDPTIHMLQEHYRANYGNGMELDQIQPYNLVETFMPQNSDIVGNYDYSMETSNNMVEISDDSADNDLFNNDHMVTDSWVEISDDDDDDDDDDQDNTVKTDDELAKITEFILHQRSSTRPHHTATGNNLPTPRSMNAFTMTKILYDRYFAKWIPQIECPLCKSTFTKYSKYSKHFKREHFTEKFYFMCCQRKFKHRNHLVEHIGLHLNPNMFRCHVCGATLSRRGSLKRHFRLRHSDEFTKDEIEQIFQNKSLNKTPVEIVQDEVLKDIPKIYRSPLNDSVTDISLEQEVLPITKNPITDALQTEILKLKYKCTLCEARFCYNGNLIRHLKIYHNNNPSLNAQEINNYLGTHTISSNSSTEQLATSSNQPYPLAIEQISYGVDQSNVISSPDILTNDAEVHEIVSETNDGLANDNEDIKNDTEIQIPATDIVVKTEKDEECIFVSTNNAKSHERTAETNDDTEIQIPAPDIPVKTEKDAECIFVSTNDAKSRETTSETNDGITIEYDTEMQIPALEGIDINGKILLKGEKDVIPNDNGDIECDNEIRTPAPDNVTKTEKDIETRETISETINGITNDNEDIECDNEILNPTPDNAFKIAKDEECVNASTNDAEVPEIISKTNDGLTNDNEDIECDTEMQIPALESVDINEKNLLKGEKDVIPNDNKDIECDSEILNPAPDNALKIAKDEECVNASTNDAEVHEIISKTNDGLPNDNEDIECNTEMQIPALESVEINEKNLLKGEKDVSTNDNADIKCDNEIRMSVEIVDAEKKILSESDKDSDKMDLD